MNLNGRNGLACTTAIADLKGDVCITPLPHMEVIKDLVPDFTHFYAQYASIRPWLQTVIATPSGKERLQSPEQRRSSTGSTNASCAPAALPLAQATGGTRTSSSAPRSCFRLIAGWQTAATR